MSTAEKCVRCGAIIPEGRQICPQCENGTMPIDYLRTYRNLGRDIDVLCAEADRLRLMSTRTSGAINLSGIRGKTVYGASFETVVDKLVDEQREIDRMIDRYADMRSQANNIINAVEDARLRQLLRLRYICGWSWERIARKMNYNLDHVRGYLHREAIRKVNTH